MSKNLTTLNVNVKITATSDKQKFRNDNPRKSIYFTADEQTQQRLNNFGLRPYKSKEDETIFYIAQAAQRIQLFDLNNENYATISGVAEDAVNFHSDGNEVRVALVKGKSQQFGNEFIRLTAIKTSDPDHIIEVAAINPFEDDEETEFTSF